jgi:hypothetical protein
MPIDSYRGLEGSLYSYSRVIKRYRIAARGAVRFGRGSKDSCSSCLNEVKIDRQLARLINSFSRAACQAVRWIVVCFFFS